METITPELLKELKDSYESKEFLSTNERRLLCSSIVDYFENRRIKFSSYIMDDLAEQIVEHFPTEDKVFSKNKDIFKGHTFFKAFFSNSLRNPGVIMMVPTLGVAFFSVVVTHVETSKLTTHPLKNRSLILPQVRMKMMKRNL